MRFLIAVLVVVLALLQARLWLADDGLREVWRLEDEVARRTEDNGRLAARNAALEGEVKDLKQGLAAAEERARTELGMIKAGETFYQIAPAPPAAEPPQPAASPPPAAPRNDSRPTAEPRAVPGVAAPRPEQALAP
ncbi:MAG TPA: cell division protein FtsB [Gammaproteobacteria bacterium]|nr:cell division protein FtsB [Gammaproteobacteria bacterium]